MKLLALDTSSGACAVAVGDGSVLLERHNVIGNGHADRILRDIEELLGEAGWSVGDLDGVACGHGPGSFTGVRIGVSATQAIAYGADIPAVGVSSLRVMAQGSDVDNVVAAYDARMGQVYVGGFTRDAGGCMQIAAEERVCAPQDFSLAASDSDASWAGVGSGFTVLEGALAAAAGIHRDAVATDVLPHAADLMTLARQDFADGKGGDAVMLLPNYIRNDVAKTTAQRDAERAAHR